MDASQIVLTAEGRQKLVEELAWREGDYAKEIVEDIKEARAFGHAIIGHGEGDSVEVVTPSGKTRVYTIAKIAR